VDRKKLSEKEIEALYDEGYVRLYEERPINRLVRLVSLMDLRSSDIVADFACGNGMMLEVVHDRVNFYHGVDFSEEFIKAARRRQKALSIGNAAFHCQSIEGFCGDNRGRFDKAFALDFSEHVYDEEWVRICQSIKCSLKESGRFYLHTPNAEFCVERLKERGVLRQFPEHIAVRNAKQNINLLKMAGFRDIRLVYLPHYLWQLGWLHGFARIPLVGKYFRARLFIECRPH